MMGSLAPGRFDVSIIGTVGVPAAYGGFETLADQLCRHLASSRQVQVFCSGADQAARPTEYAGAKLSYLSLRANGVQSIPYDMLSMLLAARKSRTLLILGVSGGLALPLIRIWAPKARIVTNVDGIEWRRSKWGTLARLVLRLSEAAAVRFSHAIVADNAGIQAHLTLQYGRDSTLIAYGGDTHACEPGTPVQTEPGVPQSYHLLLCRIEPENNVHAVLEAFASVDEQPLVAVGNWQHSDYARALHAKYANHPNIHLLDPIYAPQRVTALRKAAKSYVHGHSAGGTNPSLVEAMHAGLPVLAYDVEFNRHTTENRAAYWQDAHSLSLLIRNTSTLDLQQNAQLMHDIAQARYQWKSICEAYDDLLFPD